MWRRQSKDSGGDGRHTQEECCDEFADRHEEGRGGAAGRWLAPGAGAYVQNGFVSVRGGRARGPVWWIRRPVHGRDVDGAERDGGGVSRDRYPGRSVERGQGERGRLCEALGVLRAWSDFFWVNLPRVDVSRRKYPCARRTTGRG